MDKIITKLIRKYFEHLLKNKWMKKIIEIPIDKQKQLIEEIEIDIDILIDNVLELFENHIEIVKSSIEYDIETAINESKDESKDEAKNEEDVWGKCNG